MLRRMIDFFLGMKMMTQIFLLNAVIVLLLLAALGVLAFENLWSDYIENEIAFSASAAINLRDYLLDKEDFVFKTAREGLNPSAYVGGRGFQYLQMLDEEDDAVDAGQLKLNLVRYMEHRYGLDSDLTAILLYSPHEDVVYPFSRMGSMIGQVDAQTQADMRGHLDKVRLTVSLRPAIQEGYSVVPSYSMLLNVRSTGSYNVVGVLKHDFSVQAITDYLGRYYGGVRGRFLVCDEAGGVLYDSAGELYGGRFPDPATVRAPGGYTTTEDGQYYVSVEESRHLGIRVYGVVSRQELSRGFTATIRSLLAIMAVVFLAFLAITYIVNHRRGRQIQEITDVMDNTRRGNLSYRIPPSRSRNELHTIGESYNQTLDDLEEFIHSAYISELSKKQFQLMALRAQVNPHFLYNTLEAIRMKALSSGAGEAAEMTYILARLFRNTVKSTPFTTVAEEMDSCRDYLRLHEIRYLYSLSYQFHIPREVRSCGVIRRIAQPLVENFIVHGFDITREDNHIDIAVGLEGDDLVFSIRDNGVGMAPERLRELQLQLEGDEGEVPVDSIGLANIHQRIRLVYGRHYGVQVESSEAGTAVTVRIENRSVEELMNRV